MYWSSSCGRITLQITKAQAEIGSHHGQCDNDVAYLRTLPVIARQLRKVDVEALRRDLREYGAWDTEQLADHEENLTRLLWLACSDIREGNC